MKSYFESRFGPNPEPIKDKALYFDIKLIEAPYTLLGLSYVQFFVKHPKIRVEYKKTKIFQDKFYIQGHEEAIALSSPTSYEIVLSKIPKHMPSSFFQYLSHCISLNFCADFSSKKITYYNAFESSFQSKELNLAALQIEFKLKNSKYESEFNHVFLKNLEEKLTNYNLSLATIRFNDLFNLSFTKDESKWLTELIAYKTKTEEIYESLEHKIDFAVELMNQIEEKTSVFYNYYTEKVVKNQINISENLAIFLKK